MIERTSGIAGVEFALPRRVDPSARGTSGNSPAPTTDPGFSPSPVSRTGPQDEASPATEAGAKAPGQLNEEQQAEVQKLKAADRKVRAHEMAHLAAGAGIVTSGAQFEYKKGPDGQLYAVGGEVGIDTSPVRGDPAATITKAGKIQRAALAPADPSPQDRKVAAQAAQMASQARLELARQQGQERTGGGDSAQVAARNAAPFAVAVSPTGGKVDQIA